MEKESGQIQESHEVVQAVVFRGQERPRMSVVTRGTRCWGHNLEGEWRWERPGLGSSLGPGRGQPELETLEDVNQSAVDQGTWHGGVGQLVRMKKVTAPPMACSSSRSRVRFLSLMGLKTLSTKWMRVMLSHSMEALFSFSFWCTVTSQRLSATAMVEQSHGGRKKKA